MRLSRSYRRGRGAFTLIELLVVLAIIGVLTLVSITSYSAYRKNRRVRSAAESVNNVLVAARSFAVSTNEWHRVVFEFQNPTTNAEQYSFWVDQIDSSPSSRVINPVVPAPPVKPKVIAPHRLPERSKISDIRVDATYAYPTVFYVVIHFSPDGSSDDAAIYLINSDADPAVATNYYTVRLYGPTAKPKIYAQARVL